MDKKMDARVEFNYVAQEPDELTLRKGDIIKDIKVMPGGWWEGTLRDKRGMFPDNFVKMLEAYFISPNVIGGLKNEAEGSSNSTKKEAITLRNGETGRKWCKVLYSYEPCNEDEIQLVPNDSIEFLGEVEEGWWSGRLRGRIGVFPSNFVSPPIPEQTERQHEYCQVLFPYTAANEDELTLAEDEIVTIISRDVPDKGWWKGSLRGKIGLFPDNFVKIIDKKDTFEHEQELWQEPNQTGSRLSGPRQSSSLHTNKRGEKAHARKSLESNAATFLNNEKKNVNHSSVSTSLKRMTEKNQVKIVGNVETHTTAHEELDGVEREGDTPLLHLTASRAKAPRRRLPSSHHVRNHGGNVTINTVETQCTSSSEETLTNGAIDTVDDTRDDHEEVDRLICKIRKKIPWIEELKLNQMEKKRVQPADKNDRPESMKKERNNSRLQLQSFGGSELSTEACQDNGDIKPKEKEGEKEIYQRTDSPRTSTCSVSSNAASCSTPAYVPYRLYCQLLERVSYLEERQTELQRIVAQLLEQLNPSLDDAPVVNNKL